VSSVSYTCRSALPGRHTPEARTRILIIDDDRKPAPLLSPSDGESADGLEMDSARQSRALPPESEGRPIVHEFQVPMPLPTADSNHTGSSEIDDASHPDASVVRELIARVEELLHRTRGMPAGTSPGWGGTIRFGSVLLEPASQTVLRGGQAVRVTHTEFRLLLALMRRRGAIASRMELLREVWGAGAAVSRRAVDTHIARLRRKLEENPAKPRHILTALAWGYRFRP
jgi:hypothetical protein